MELTIPIVCTIISVVFCIATFVTNRMDKAKSNAKENNYELIKYQVSEIKEDVKEILSKMDKYEKDVKDQIDEAMKLHIKMYHSKKRGE